MTHSVVIHAIMMSWVPGRRSGKPACDVLMYLDHWRSPDVVEVVEETHEDPCLMKKLLKKSLEVV